MQVHTKITSLPTRYEPLVSAFGSKASTTFVQADEDLEVLKRLITSARTSNQGKIIFLSAASGSGKSTFVHSLKLFLPDYVEEVQRLPEAYELAVNDIPGYLAKLPKKEKFTVVNFDGREAPAFDKAEYQTFLGALNSLLRTRGDLLVVWPVTDTGFAERLVNLLQQVGGNSPFGSTPLHPMKGLPQSKYNLVLEKILQIANWRLDDAAISNTEVEVMISSAERIGSFLDSLQGLITQRFNISPMGVEFPTLVLALTSSQDRLRDVCRQLRRADSFYIEASRLLMFTKTSNVAEWWAARATDLQSALPHVIALFNAQLVSCSASSVVHSVLQEGTVDLKALVRDVQSNTGNAKTVVQSSELYKFMKGEPVDNKEYGSSVKRETLESYIRIQDSSQTKHLAINRAVITQVLKTLETKETKFKIEDFSFEKQLRPGLQSDVSYSTIDGITAVEFHHKAAAETVESKVAIYILSKLKEYAINYGVAKP